MKIYRTYRAHCARYIPTLEDSHICKEMHGHTFNIVVFLDGPINSKTGFVMDFFDLDKIVNKEVISIIDHKVLNDINGLTNPSSEHLAVFVWEKLKNKLSNLSKISISEDHGTGIEYSG
tara:strand:+ start:93 stop:449 length:357 start_codon:yes stop_codon:yes gene_type:complete